MKDKAERNERFFEEYRSLRKNLSELNSEIQSLTFKQRELHDKKSTVEREIESMRKIITAIVDEDADPIELKLRGLEDVKNNNMWNQISDLQERIKHLSLTSPGSAYPLGQVSLGSQSMSMPLTSISIPNSIYTTGNMGSVYNSPSGTMHNTLHDTSYVSDQYDLPLKTYGSACPLDRLTDQA